MSDLPANTEDNNSWSLCESDPVSKTPPPIALDEGETWSQATLLIQSISSSTAEDARFDPDRDSEMPEPEPRTSSTEYQRQQPLTSDNPPTSQEETRSQLSSTKSTTDSNTPTSSNSLEHYVSGGIKILYKEPWKGEAWKSEDELSLVDRDTEFETWISTDGSRNAIKRKGDMNQDLEKWLQKMSAYPNQDWDGPKSRTNKGKDQIWKDLYKISLKPSQCLYFG